MIGLWRVGTAQCKRRHGIARPIKLQMVEIYLAIGNEVNKSVTADVAEIPSGLCLWWLTCPFRQRQS